MHKTISVFFVLFLFSVALAQENAKQAPLITASSSANRVRFAAPGTIVQMRVQVYSAAAQVVFDATSKGNVLDWSVHDGSGARLDRGDYLYVVTVKSLDGKLRQRIGEVSVQDQGAEVRAAEKAQLTAAQQREVGPVEEDAAIVVLKESESEAITVMVHNGEQGQLVRGRGALSFRIGDFFSGKDIEQMRLTPEGNLGIGFTHPQARLDVDGLIRTSHGIVFPDGTIQYSASSRTLGARSATPDGKSGSKQEVHPQGGGTGTQDHIARWLDNAGTLGDSVIFQSISVSERRLQRRDCTSRVDN